MMLRFAIKARTALVCAVLSLGCAAVLLAAVPQLAYADFTVYVGYSGGPYYEKIRYSDSDMSALSDAKLYEYTTFDAKPSLRKGFATGVRLESLFLNAGVDAGQLKRFYFSTLDNYIADDGVEGYGAWTYDYLVNTTRYYFPNLVNVYDFEEGTLDDYDAAWEGAVSVPALLATSSSFTRVSSKTDSAWTSTAFMTPGYRLLYGQSDPAQGDARSYASVIRAVTCIFHGTPDISFGEDASQGFEATVGDTVTIKAPTITAADPLISAYGKFDINWTVSDPGVADFVRDDNGNVVMDEDGNVQLVIIGEGDVSITASYGNSPSSTYRTSASLGGHGKGSGGGGSGGGGGQGGGGQGGGGDQGGGDSGGTSLDDGDKNPSDQDQSDAAPEGIVGSEQSDEGDGDEGDGEDGGQQAWKISAKKQDVMVDDLLFGSPMAVALAIFGMFVLGFVGRVVVTERQKDPLVDRRLARQ